METTKVYHGTNKECAESILNSTFRLPSVPDMDSPDEKKKRFYEYWLGPGVYLFKDYEIADWWSKNPPKPFSHSGEPAVIQCSVDTSLDKFNVVNLMDFDTISKISQSYILFQELCKNKLDIILPKYENANPQNQLRSLFFKTMQESKKIDVFIGAFLYENSEFYTQGMKDFHETAGLIFPEIQYCVYTVECIDNMQIV